MTDADKRQEKAMLLLECQEAEQDFALLSEKARKLGDKLRVVIGHLDTARTDLSVKRLPEMIHKPITELPLLREALDADAIEALLEELRQMREKVMDLRGRKTAIGLK